MLNLGNNETELLKNMIKLIKELLGIGWYQRLQARKLALIQAKITKKELDEKRRRDARNAERIKFFPIMHIKRGEFDKIPKGESVDLNTCPLDTLFVCTPSEFAPGVIVVGHVVPGLKLIAEQWGSGMSIPERGINRYRVQFAD